MATLTENAPTQSSAAKSTTTGQGNTLSFDETGCLFAQKVSEFCQDGPHALSSIMRRFQEACSQDNFINFLDSKGFSGSSFHTNDQLVTGKPSYDKFINALGKLNNKSSLAIVFHGTKHRNLENIKR